MKKIIRATLCSAFLVLSVVSAATEIGTTAATPGSQSQEQSRANWAWD
jgi:hypothetical protein